MRRRLQIAGGLRLGAQLLDSVEHILLLREEGIAELLGPVQLRAHHFKRLRHRGERLDARVPGLGLHRIFKRGAFHRRIGLRPARRFHDLERIGRSHQHLGQQRIRIERDRRHQLLDLPLRELLLRLGLGLSRSGGILRTNGRDREPADQHERHGADSEPARRHNELVCHLCSPFAASPTPLAMRPIGYVVG